MILPARGLFFLTALNAGVGLLVSIQPAWLNLWYATVGTGLLLAFIDLLLLVTEPSPRGERKVPHSLPLGVKRQIRIRLHNTGKRPLQIQLFDHYPHSLQSSDFPITTQLPKQEFIEHHYDVVATLRGKLQFPCLQVRLLSPWRFWWHDLKLPVVSEVKVYPNFAAVAQYALLATDNHLSHMGIMKKRRRGEGQDFHQLREYRAGDSLRQIDWKASSRMRRAISREYQDERDQEIIFMLDCGHRMLAQDDALSHFDHTLNAMLLLSYVALQQGDAVGLGTFAGEQRWVPARKGQHNVQHLLDTLYDLQPTTQAPDYAQAATQLLVRQKKRALIILLTNLRDEDMDDLLPAIQLLRKRHMVLLSSMREQALDDVLTQATYSHEERLDKAAVQYYLQQRKHAVDQVRATGVRCLDIPPQELSVNLINHYLDIKRTGLL